MNNSQLTGGAAKKIVSKLSKSVDKKSAMKKLSKSKPKSMPKPAKKTTYKPKKSSSKKSSPKLQAVKSASQQFMNSLQSMNKSDETMERTLLFFRFFMSSIYFGSAIFIYYQIFYKYFAYLEDINCNCAIRNWKYYTLRIYFMYMLALLISDFVSVLFNLNHPRTFSSYILDDVSQSRFAQFNMLLHVFMIIIANMYIQDLHSSQCECSEHLNRDIFTVISILELLVYAFLGLRVFIFLFSFVMGNISRAVY